MKRKANKAPSGGSQQSGAGNASTALLDDAAAAKRPQKCQVCNSEYTSPTSTEGLCWICRRLKISAWRDSDNQLATSE